MRTIVRLLMVSAMVLLPYGISKADPRVQGLIQIDDRPYYDHPTVNIWTDASRYFIGEEVRITVTVDRPSFVTVYNIDAAGRVRRLTDRASGAWVTPGRPLYLPEERYTRLVANGPEGIEELVAVASPVEFGHYDDLPYYRDVDYDRLPWCEHDRNGYIEKVNRRLMHDRGYSARSVARTTFWVEDGWRRPWGVHIDIGIDIPVGAHVYADGVYIGIGPACLESLRPGSHRITVRTPRGRKITRQVTIPRDYRYRGEVERNRYDQDDRREMSRYDRDDNDYRQKRDVREDKKARKDSKKR